MKTYTLTIPALRIAEGSRTKHWIGFYVSHIYKQPRRVQLRHKAWVHHVWSCIRAHPQLKRIRGMNADGWRVSTQAYFASKTHADAENVHKGLVDALVLREGKSSIGSGIFTSDKQLAGAYGAPMYDKENPRIDVVIERHQ